MPASVTVDAILFDMDGTLIDSTPGVIAAWEAWSVKYQLGDFTQIVHNAHGRRLQDSLKEYCGITDEHRLTDEVLLFEEEVIRAGPVALPGSKELLSQLCSHPESQLKWTIVTSASNKFAKRAFDQAGIPIPAAGIVTANDVSRGKPHPDPYLAGAALCSADPRKCLVVEDAISGLVAGHTAGALTLAVCTSTERVKLVEGGKPDFIVRDLTNVSVDVVDGKIQLTIDQ